MDRNPYYSNSKGEFYKADVLDFLKDLDDKSVDLIIVDPPYNIEKAKWDSVGTVEEYSEWCEKWLKEFDRVLTKKGTAYVFGYSENLAYLKVKGDQIFPRCKWLVWHYTNKPNLRNDWGRSHESILHFRKHKDFTFNVDEVRVPYNDHTLNYPEREDGKSSNFGSKEKYKWTPHPKGARPRDVLEMGVINNGMEETTSHPTQKPEGLIEKLVLASSNEDDLVLDPMAGSGTTFAVCQKNDRNWIGCEKEEEYCEIIKDRIEEIEEKQSQATLNLD